MEINKKSLSITTNNKTSFKIIPFGLIKSFNIILNNRASFSLPIAGFDNTEKYSIRMLSKILTTAYASLTMEMNTNISSKIKMIVSWNVFTGYTLANNITHKMAITIRSKVRQILHIYQGVNLAVNLVLGDKKTMTVISNYVLTLTPQIRKYYLLSDWDSTLLSVMDTKTLAELDYQLL